MQNYSLSGRRLGRQALLFPLCLVLYEFSTYIGNDMIQPGMLAVVQEFQVGNEWVPTSMTAYLAGGMFLQWLLGPLSDRIGRRPVMLTGVVWFIVTCLATLLAQTIEQFTLLRFLQGISLCFIGAVGYAAIQESFEEAVCIKITALMANVALIAPLLGPLVGADWVHILPWEMMFVLFAVLAAISFFGLQRAMPETATRLGEKLSVKELGRDYRLVLKNLRFVAGALATGFVSLPLLVSFMPMLMDTAGNCGNQISTLMVRGLALGEVEPADFVRVLGKELRVSAIVGAVLGIVNGLRIYLMYTFLFPGQYANVMGYAIVVSVSLFFSVILAKLVGGMLPLAAKKLGADPAIMATPFITTIVDACSLILYFQIAQLVFHNMM